MGRKDEEERGGARRSEEGGVKTVQLLQCVEIVDKMQTVQMCNGVHTKEEERTF